MSAAVAAGIYSAITTNGTLAALVSTRVYPVSLPELAQTDEIQACICYALTGRNDEHDFKGKKLAREQWEFMCCASSYDVAHQIADAVEVLLGGMNRTAWGSINVSSRMSDMSDERYSAPELGIFAVQVDIGIDY